MSQARVRSRSARHVLCFYFIYYGFIIIINI